MAETLLFASRNRGKIAEVTGWLQPLGYQVSSMLDLPQLAELEIDETGETFAENAQLKAQTCFDLTGLVSLGDDSGLEVTAFDGWPGVISNRWFAGTDAERNQAMLDKMSTVADRQACFVTVLCLIVSGQPHFFTGELKGTLAQEARGQEGFGYDTIFIPTGQEKTLAELGLTYKNQVSHRAQALQTMKDYLSTR